MSEQASLLDWSPARAVAEESIQRRFEAFHAENPHVYAEVVRLARAWRERKGPRAVVGIDVLWSHLRWTKGMETDGDAFRLNNSWRSRLARLVMANEPDLAGVFNTRELKSL